MSALPDATSVKRSGVTSDQTRNARAVSERTVDCGRSGVNPVIGYVSDVLDHGRPIRVKQKSS